MDTKDQAIMVATAGMASCILFFYAHIRRDAEHGAVNAARALFKVGFTAVLTCAALYVCNHL